MQERLYRRRSLKERFFEKLPPESERDPEKCMEWQGGLITDGYGQISIGGNDNKHVLAHRFYWEFATGRKIPEGMCVLHSCDNPKCVNPFHLRLGTKADNARDMVERGRQNLNPLFGEANGKAKVPDDLIREAVSLVKSGMTQAAAARMIRSRGYECDPSSISYWISGKCRSSAFSEVM